MKVTFLAASKTNSVLKQIDSAAEAFCENPELFNPAFWELVAQAASNINTAQFVLDDLDIQAAKGISVSKFVSINLVQAMRIARTTLRNHELNRT